MTLAQNSGADGTKVLNQLRQKHAAAGPDGRWWGVDCMNCTVCDAFQNYIWEPVLAAQNSKRH